MISFVSVSVRCGFAVLEKSIGVPPRLPEVIPILTWGEKNLANFGLFDFVCLFVCLFVCR